MIIQNEMLAIKSTENVIRSVCFEFNHFSIDQMDILRHIISEYLETDTAIFTKGKSCIIKCNDNFIEKRLLNEGIRIYDELLSVLNIELHIWGKPSKKGVLYVSAPFHLDGITPKHIKQELIEVVPDEEEREVKVANIRKLENVLLSNNNLTTLQLDDEFVDAFIARIEPCEGRKFKWYLNIGSGKGWGFFNKDAYELYDYWTLNFENARRYRKANNQYLRENQWEDLHVEVYIRTK